VEMGRSWKPRRRKRYL